MNPLHWLFRRNTREADLSDEIQTHLRMAMHDAVDRGETLPNAAASVRREFGNVSLVKEVTREMWGWTSLERLGQDLRYAGRLLRKSPGFTAVAILSMALGIGANTAIFSLIDAALLRSLPVRSPNELVAIGDPTRVGSLVGGLRENRYLLLSFLRTLSRAQSRLHGCTRIRSKRASRCDHTGCAIECRFAGRATASAIRNRQLLFGSRRACTDRAHIYRRRNSCPGKRARGCDQLRILGKKIRA